MGTYAREMALLDDDDGDDDDGRARGVMPRGKINVKSTLLSSRSQHSWQCRLGLAGWHPLELCGIYSKAPLLIHQACVYLKSRKNENKVESACNGRYNCK